MDINHDAPATASAETLIHAPLSHVWALQADLEGWPRWNAAVTRMNLRGPLAAGTEFRWKAGGLSITSTLQEVTPPHRIVWTGRAPGLRAVHVWHFEAADGGTRAHTAESFEGWLARLLPGLMRKMLAASLEQGLAALKTACEQQAPRAGI